MNINLENKLIAKYWIDKLKLYPAINIGSTTLLDTKEFLIESDELYYFNKLTANNEIAGFTVLLSIFNILLKRYFETVHFIASSEIRKKSTLLFNFDSIKEKTLKQCLNGVKTEVLAHLVITYGHSKS